MTPCAAAANPAESDPYRILRAESEITIDGELDEAVWKTALGFNLEYEVRPGENIEPPVATRVMVTYDKSAIYFAFLADDPEPKKIRARYVDRDQAWNDDWVGVVLDTFNDQRRAYELFSTPLGVQIDAINDETGGSYDSSWNAIWASAGKLTEDGFQVEMKIPFSQIRFQTVDGEQVWGFDAIRSYPRENRHHIGLFPRDRGANSYLSQTVKIVGMDDVSAGRNLELTPTVTASRSEARENGTSGPFESSGSDEEIGATVRWGITPNLTLNGALNPDFSQVEADAVQLDVNETFALFFPETRPFFLEGADFFNTRLRLLNTRSIAVPDGAVKLTGKQDRHTYGVIAAQDASTAMIIPGAERSSGGVFDFDSTALVGRYRMDFGGSSTVGGMATSRSGDGYSNEVISADTNWRPTESDLVYGSFARSSTEYNDEMRTAFNDPANPGADLPEGTFSDEFWNVGYRHDRRTWRMSFDYSDIGDGFVSDLGFRPQVGIKRWVAGGSYVKIGTEKTRYNEIRIGGDIDRTTLQDGSLLEEEVEGWFQWSGPLESFVFLDVGTRNRTFEGVEYPQDFVNVFYEMRPNKNVAFFVGINQSDWIDFAENRPAELFNYDMSLNLNIGKHLQFAPSYASSALDVEGGQLFRTQVSQLRAIYQFNNRLRFRAILQHVQIDRNVDLILDPDLADATAPEVETLLSQLLLSYKLNGQSAVYLGYSDGRFGDQDISLVTTDRTLFLKIGYAWLL